MQIICQGCGAYIGEEMSELFDKLSECIKREFEEKFPGFTQAPASPQKSVQWKRNKEKKKWSAQNKLQF